MLIDIIKARHSIRKHANEQTGFVILGYIDGEQPKSKPRKPGRIKIVE